MAFKDKALKHSDLIATALLAFGAAVVLLYLARPISDPDFFWHLKTGEWIWQHNSLPTTDPFSIQPPPAGVLRSSFILTSYWLAQLIFYLFYTIGGWAGIIVLRLLLVSASATVLASWCNFRDFGRACLLILLSIQMLEVYPLERPQVFSFIGFAALIAIIERFVRQGEDKSRIWVFAALLSALMLVWSNLHGGFVIGQTTLALFVGMEGLKFIHPSLRPLPTKRFRALVIITLATLATSLINPNPINSFRILLGLGNSNSFLHTTNIEYFSALTVLRDYKDYTVLLNLFLMALVGYVLLASIKRIDITWLVLLAATSYMGYQHVRYMPFFLIAAVMFLAKHLDIGGIREYVLKTAIVAATFVSVFFFVPGEVHNIRTALGNGFSVSKVFPVKAADFVVERNLKGPIFNTFLWGGYLIWRLGPERKVFCDGRQLDAGRYWEWLNSDAGTASGEPYWKGLFRKYGIQTAILPLFDSSGLPDPLASALRTDNDWKLVFAKDNTGVFTRTDGIK